VRWPRAIATAAIFACIRELWIAPQQRVHVKRTSTLTTNSCRDHEGFAATRGIVLRLLILLLLQFCLLTLLLPSEAVALDLQQRLNQLHHRAWTARDGLTGSPQCLAQTADGFLWIGTSDGLFRFDGVQFERFRPEAGELPAVSVSALLAISDGGLWVGYSRGRASFINSDGRVTNYSDREGLPFGKVRSFARGHDGTVWVAAIGGLARLEGGRWLKIRMEWNYPCGSAWRLFVDRQGTLWVGGASPNRIHFLPKGARKFQDTGLTSIALAFAQAADNTILFQDDNAPERLYALPREHDGLGEPRLVAQLAGQQLAIDRDGGTWITGNDVVRVRVSDRASKPSGGIGQPVLERFARAEGLSGRISSDVLEDREGNIWVATDGGLDRFRNRNLSWARHRDDAAPVNLVAGNNGDIWALAPWPPPLVRVQDGKAVAGAPKALFTGFHHPDGAIWIAGEDSLWRWKGDRFFKLDPPDVVLAKRIPFRVLAATTDQSERLWVSLGGIGEFYLKDGNWTFVEVLPGRPNLTAIAAHTDAADRVWLAYRDEVAAIERGKVRVFSKSEGLGVGALLALAGRDRQIWVGGESGLAVLQDDRFQTVRIAGIGGFGSVTGILVVKSGVWLSTGSGIVHIPEQEVQRLMRDPAYPVTPEVLDLVSDLPEPLQTRNGGEAFNAAVEGTDGLLWFVTTNGVVRVDPGRITRNPLPPPVVIRSVVADDKSYSPRRAITLPPLSKTIRIDYGALSLSIPERVKFRYRLDGWDTEWHDADTRRTAFYTQLGPGSYGFRVIGCNNDRVWNEAGTTIAFTVAPAWFQTVWFRGLVAVSMGALLLTLYRFRVRQVRRALSVRFDERLAERTRIARDLHDTLLQSVQASKMIAENALDDTTDPEGMRSAIQRLSEWLDQAVLEGRTALNSLRTTTVAADDLADAFRRAAATARKPETLTVAVNVGGQSRHLHPVVRDEIYRIGSEAIRNACAHSGGTLLTIDVDYTHDLTLAVADNGVGIDPIVYEKGKDGRFGLRGMRERAASIGGRLTVISSASGTSITLVVPGRTVFRSKPEH
jgi:signal transduction histidine kinase/ligand-binding sensor domain-containing protein